MRILFATLLLAVRVGAQAPGWPWGGGDCATDWDCSLGGICSQNFTCVCDPWFTGADCHMLNLQRAASAQQGLLVPGYNSWGGHPVLVGDTFHLFVSFMCDRATLDSYGTKSSIFHAVSESPVGPFTLPHASDADLVVPPFAHGAMITQDPQSGLFLLFHLGAGDIAPSEWSPCFSAASPDPVDPRPAAASDKGTVRVSVNRQAFVHSSASVEGPWKPVNNGSGLDVEFPAGSWTSLVDNPAPFVFPNGTTLLYFRAELCPADWGALAPACLGVARASSWNGTYTSLFTQPITHPEGEDPAVFRDPRGNFHMLTNVNTYHNRCEAGVPCGGHAWSYDGLVWSNQSIGAFGPWIRFANGSYLSGSYVERPQIYAGPDGAPTAFYAGFGFGGGSMGYGPTQNWAQLFCTQACLDSGTCQCGPMTPPPLRLAQNGSCLVTNATFPCPGGLEDSCPVFLGACRDPMANWLVSRGSLTNMAVSGTVLNIDCYNCTAGTLVKITNLPSYVSPVRLDVESGLLRAPSCPGMCLSGTPSLPRNPPCNPAPEFWMDTQIVLVPCTSPAALGWAPWPYE